MTGSPGPPKRELKGGESYGGDLCSPRLVAYGRNRHSHRIVTQEDFRSGRFGRY